MRGILIGAAVVIVGAAVVGAVILMPSTGDAPAPRPSAAPAPATTFTADGHRFSCGPDSTVTLTVAFSYPGPSHGAYLDGVELPDGPPDDGSPGGAYFPVARPTVFSCAEHGTHRIRQDVGHPTDKYIGCGITLSGSAVAGEGQVTSGKNVTPITNVWHAGDTVCDVTWST